jgi:RimJ/RimL family protein N-acetyltransferase
MTNIPPLTLRLTRDDRDTLLQHFLSLDLEDRRLRFGTPAGDTVVREYVERLDFVHNGLFAVRDAEGAIVAAVHVASGGKAAELGLSVSAGHRGRGCGGALFARAVDFLRNRGTRKVFVHCLAENEAMRHLAARHGMRLTTDGIESQGYLTLPEATPESQYREWLQDQQAAAVEILRRNTQVARLLWRLC